eukprot:350982-Chlamydomonas_euryale.AAC.1
MRVVAELAVTDSVRDKAVELGAVPLLVARLAAAAKHGMYEKPAGAGAAAACALAALARNHGDEYGEARCRAIADGGAVPLLLDLAVAGSADMVTGSAAAIAGLAHGGLCEVLVAAGGVTSLVRLLSRSDAHADAKANAARALGAIAAASAKDRKAAVDAGAVPVLKALAEHAADPYPFQRAREEMRSVAGSFSKVFKPLAQKMRTAASASAAPSSG